MGTAFSQTPGRCRQAAQKILVVDDIAENRAVVTDLLAPLGFEVTEAANGREGVEMAQRLRPDLILMDIAMPELDGLAVARLLRQREAFREVPILAMSASDSAQSLAAGMNAFLPKPLDADKLLEQMARLLRLEWTYGAAQSEGSFYPDQLPLDQDNDLVIVADHNGPAAGEITHLTGRILDLHGNPLRGVMIEIWQADHNGHYIHSADASSRNDANFQGFGRFETDQTGQYRFRTLKPVPYPGRTPHIHVKLRRGGRELLTTQLYVQGHPLNERDGVLRNIRNPKQRASVMVPFLPCKEHRGELAARFDIVLEMTPRM